MQPLFRNAAIYRNAQIVIAAVHGPRPVSRPFSAPMSVGTFAPDPVALAKTQVLFDAHFDAMKAQRAWDKRVNALTLHVAHETRCIRDREPVAMRRAA